MLCPKEVAVEPPANPVKSKRIVWADQEPDGSDSEQGGSSVEELVELLWQSRQSKLLRKSWIALCFERERANLGTLHKTLNEKYKKKPEPIIT